MKTPQRFSRRRVLELGALAGLAGVTGCSGRRPEAVVEDEPAVSEEPVIGKKGLCLTTKADDWKARLSSVNCDWFYTWGALRPPETPEGVAFTPMVFGYWGDEDRIAEAGRKAREAGITELLGFNEPDKRDQSNMSVEKALEVWPLLEATGLRLGSPACVHPDKEWMRSFMERAEERKLRVDFVCVHSYHGPNVEAMVRRFTEAHRLYGKPLWITEFAVGDWEAKSPQQNRHKPEAILRFMEKALPALEKLDFVERYAWFPAKPDNRALGTSALFEDDGSMTRLGEFYRDFTA